MEKSSSESGGVTVVTVVSVRRNAIRKETDGPSKSGLLRGVGTCSHEFLKDPYLLVICLHTRLALEGETVFLRVRLSHKQQIIGHVGIFRSYWELIVYRKN